MKNSYFVCILVSLALFSMLVMAGCASSPGGATAPFTADIYVAVTGSNDAGNGSFSKPYRTIQFALDKAGTGEVVGVLAGLYVESLTWPKTWEGITLRGLSMDTAILSAEANKQGISIKNTNSPQTITIESMTIQNGNFATAGGGIYLQDSITMNLRNVKVHHNRSTAGSGLMMQAADAVIINNCVFSSNETSSTSGSGGAICQLAGTLLISNSEFYENYGGYGNIFSGSTIEVAGCNIHDNTATNYGAGLAFTSASSPHVINTTIEGNAVLTGGDGTGGGGIYCQWTVATIESCTIKNNSCAIDNGGGVHFDASSGGIMFFIKCRFLDNHAASGGAIQSENMVDLDKCLFERNTAEAGTGGAMNLTASGTAEIVNSIFKFNKANEGGGIYSSGPSDLEIFNCTFVSNEAASNGSAIMRSNGDNMSIYNTIVWFNKNSTIKEVITGSGTYKAFYNNYKTGNFGFPFNEGNSTNAKPEFALFPTNLHLSGNCTIEITRGGTFEGAPDDDYDGDPRDILIKPYSIGAYEDDTN